MKTIIFDDKLNNETVQVLIDGIQQPYEETPETDIVLYFSSEGGFNHSANMLIDCVNTLPEEHNLKMVFYWRVYSSAFDIFVKCNCKKIVDRGAVGLVHLSSRDVGVREISNDKGSFDNFLLEDTNALNEEYLKWFQDLGFFSRRELKEISKGGDIYLNSLRLKKMLSKLKK